MQTSPLYDKDLLLWSEDQVLKFKSAKLNELDLENIMQEIEDMGKEQKVALQSLPRNLLVHLLKLNYSPAELLRAKWIGEVSEFRAQIETRLDQTPASVTMLAPFMTKRGTKPEELLHSNLTSILKTLLSQKTTHTI